LVAASVASGWTSDTARQVLAAAAVPGRRFDGRLLTAMVGLEEQAVVVAHDLPLATVVGNVLHLHRWGVTVVPILDRPAAPSSP
jgi:hypothetical protein